tara:strand:+ start:361 stop:810 length:450 start_codon:yes stop_codon:yes gene_type:complete
MNTIDKYSITKLSNAIDDAVDVSFRQMIDTIKNQCYMSQTETSWEDCDELEFLEEHPKMSTVKNAMTNDMKRVVLSALTFSDWISEDEVAKRNPNKFRKPSENTRMHSEEINDVTILALETLREQVRDAGDNYNHFRVNKVLKFYKNKF